MENIARVRHCLRELLAALPSVPAALHESSPDGPSLSTVMAIRASLAPVNAG